MGEHGSASVGLGGGGGMDMAGMAAGMAVGSAVGQNIASTLNGIMWAALSFRFWWCGSGGFCAAADSCRAISRGRQWRRGGTV